MKRRIIKIRLLARILHKMLGKRALGNRRHYRKRLKADPRYMAMVLRSDVGAKYRNKVIR